MFNVICIVSVVFFNERYERILRVDLIMIMLMMMVSMNVVSVCFYFKYKCMHLNAFNVCKPCNVWIMWYAIVLVAVMTPWALKTLEAEKMPSIKISIACPQKCDIWVNARHTFHDYTRFSPHFLSWFNNNNSKKHLKVHTKPLVVCYSSNSNPRRCMIWSIEQNLQYQRIVKQIC